MKQPQPKPLVLCEGNEDLLVMDALANHAGLVGKLAFQQYGGKNRLQDYLHLLKASPEFVRGEYSKILVTRDADLDFGSSWDALKGALKEAFDCDVGEPGVWIKPSEAPEITGWVVPGPGKTGMIETLCLDSSRTKAPAIFACLDSFANCLAGVHGSVLHEKARFEIWTIAAQGPGAKGRLSLQYAIPNLPIDWDDTTFRPLKDLLVRIAS
jgi:hypothetical protein